MSSRVSSWYTIPLDDLKDIVVLSKIHRHQMTLFKSGPPSVILDETWKPIEGSLSKTGWTSLGSGHGGTNVIGSFCLQGSISKVGRVSTSTRIFRRT